MRGSPKILRRQKLDYKHRRLRFAVVKERFLHPEKRPLCRQHLLRYPGKLLQRNKHLNGRWRPQDQPKNHQDCHHQNTNDDYQFILHSTKRITIRGTPSHYPKQLPP